MGQYKVPQNVEAEDKIIGPLTLKQFIYAVIGVMSGLVSFLTLRKAPIVMLIVGIPPTALFLLLGLYQRQDQPFEALFLSLVSFLVKPRKRLWLKEPIEEVFKIEAPKVVKAVTQRDPSEIRGQLEQLSQVVDTRGWGNKKAELQEPRDEGTFETAGRLVAPESTGPGETIETDVSMADDILDFQNNPNARGIGNLIHDQAVSIRQKAIATLHHTTPAAARPPATSQKPQASAARPATDITNVGTSNLTTDAEPLPGSTYRPAPPPPAGTPNPAAVTAAPPVSAQILPTGSQAPVDRSNKSVSDNVTPNPLDGILKLAMENDDLPVSQVAAQANRRSAQGGLAEGQSVSLRKDGNS